MRAAASPLWMMRTALRSSLTVASVCALVIAASVTLWPARAAGSESPAPVTETKVVTYEPPLPSGPNKKGSCWTSSIAVVRKGAWRCMAGNAIYDPCFGVAARPGAVVCGADPALAKPGFVMELTKPLPASDLPARVRPQPWIMRLADGTVCEKMTGTMALVDGKPVAWGCNDSAKSAKLGKPGSYSGILGDPRRGKVWTVEKVTYTATSDSTQPFKLLERKTIAVRQVWE